VVLGLALLLASSPSFAFIYRAEAIEGWVIDTDTGRPLEGVIVVAHWQLRGGFEGGTPIRQLQILETVTDKNGHYLFPAWGPKFALMGQLRSESPEILMFKPGYKFQLLNNPWYSDRDTTKSDWNGKTVKLERFTGTLGQYAQHLWLLNNTLWNAGYTVGEHSGDFCGWKSFPRMLRAMDELDRKLEPLRVMETSVTHKLRANEAKLLAAGCGSVTDLLGK
jgi:hypothetical protein